LIRESGATIAYGELPEVRADRDRLQELFRRLIDNALKYRGPSPARIEIEAQSRPARQSPQEHGFLFSVHDHGIGIDQKFQSQLFHPFRRLHGPEIPGVGLSLIICRKIVETHGGTLWIESDAGKGATVFFTLPAIN
jgi:chemotaxis family two-component system sensor kinase Cph1